MAIDGKTSRRSHRPESAQGCSSISKRCPIKLAATLTILTILPHSFAPGRARAPRPRRFAIIARVRSALNLSGAPIGFVARLGLIALTGDCSGRTSVTLVDLDRGPPLGAPGLPRRRADRRADGAPGAACAADRRSRRIRADDPAVALGLLGARRRCASAGRGCWWPTLLTIFCLPAPATGVPGREDEPVAGAEPDDEEELLAMAAE